MRIALYIVLLSVIPLQAADPVAPIHWTARQLAELETKIRSSVDPARHLGPRAVCSMRRRSSTAMVRPKRKCTRSWLTSSPCAPARARCSSAGRSWTGRVSAPRRAPRHVDRRAARATSSPPATSLYVPANTVHQFFVAPGKNFTVTIVKITPSRARRGRRLRPHRSRRRRAPRNDLPQPYRTTRDWGRAAGGHDVGGGHRRRAGAGRHHLRRRTAASRTRAPAAASRPS